MTKTAWALTQENKALKKLLKQHQEVASRNMARRIELEDANRNLGLTLQRVRTLLTKKRWWSNNPSRKNVRDAVALLGSLTLEVKEE